MLADWSLSAGHRCAPDVVNALLPIGSQIGMRIVWQP